MCLFEVVDIDMLFYLNKTRLKHAPIHLNDLEYDGPPCP